MLMAALCDSIGHFCHCLRALLLSIVEEASDQGKDTREEHGEEDEVRMVAGYRVVLLHFDGDVVDRGHR